MARNNNKGTNESNAKDIPYDSSHAMDKNEKESLISNGPEDSEKANRKDSELASIRSEYAYILSSLDHGAIIPEIGSSQVQKNRIAFLQVPQSEQQETFMQTLQQKQVEIAILKSKEITSIKKNGKTTEPLKMGADSTIKPLEIPHPLSEWYFQSYLSIPWRRRCSWWSDHTRLDAVH